MTLATMAVVGLDVSLNRTGLARLSYDDGDLLDVAVVEHDDNRDADLDKLARIAERVTEFIRPGDDTAIETGISHRNGAVTRKLAMAWAAAAMAAHDRMGTHPLEVNVSTVKMAATGRGNATKAQVTAAAVARWGLIVDDPDVADAAWIAECGRRELHRLWPIEGETP